MKDQSNSSVSLKTCLTHFVCQRGIVPLFAFLIPKSLKLAETIVIAGANMLDAPISISVHRNSVIKLYEKCVGRA